MFDETVLVLGEGGLHDAFRQSATLPIHPLDSLAALAGAPRVAVVVALFDDWRPERMVEIQRACRAVGCRMLPCQLDGALAIIGPVVGSRVGCALCAEARRRPIARLPSTPLRSLTTAGAWPAPALTGAVAVAADLTRRLLDQGGAELDGRAFVMQGKDGSGQWHPVRSVANCAECAITPDDSAEAARAPRGTTPTKDPASFRQHAHTRSRLDLRDRLLDWRYGPISHVFRVDNAPMPIAGAEFAALRDGEREAGWGRGTTYAQAEAVAFYEALERWASRRPRGKRTVVRAAYRDLSGQALDPRHLGQPDPALLARTDSPLQPFTDELVLPWVWGYSFARRAPILVPEQCVYYGAVSGRRFNYESSNGAASGSSVAEALLHGLFEIIERDAFLMTWYGQLSVPELPIEELTTRESLLLVDKLEAAGYQARLFDTTMDLGVPSIWALAVHRGDGKPRSFTAAGAHPDPERAALSALRELVPDVFMYRSEHTDDALRAMVRDPLLVRSLEDHVALYTLPEAAARLSFLDRSPRRSFAASFPDWRERWIRPSLEEVVDDLTAHVLAHCDDVIAVDLTAAGGAAIGQHTVKVIVPGALPMTFGEHHRRAHGLARLLEVPARLGHWPAPRALSDLALHPHPFP